MALAAALAPNSFPYFNKKLSAASHFVREKGLLRFDTCQKRAVHSRSARNWQVSCPNRTALLVTRYQWAAPGDVNAFFGLMLDNVANLVLVVGLLSTAFDFPANFAVSHMIPGTALGVLIGDLWFTAMAISLARRTQRNDITAMPLGLDTPSVFGMVFFVVGPAFLEAKRAGLTPDEAARQAWHIGMCAVVVSGVLKLVCAAGAGWVRRVVPRAGLLGSLAAIALVLIGFLPLLEIMQFPVVGLIALAIILTTLVARIELPFRIPGTLGALVVGSVLYYVLVSMDWIGLVAEESAVRPHLGLLPPWPTLEWMQAMPLAIPYLPVVIPFALATVIGGIDCTESAAAAGDEFDTSRVIAVEAVATLVAGVCGGVVQTTPYIGHPAYKAMGGRAAYTLATGLFIGAAGMIGYFAYLYLIIPRAAIFPILVFIGLEITAQSFHATPRRHLAAVALACLPALAYLVMIFADGIMGRAGLTIDELGAPLAAQVQTMRVLSGGFIVTSVIWASMLAALIDRQLKVAAAYCAVAALASLFGVIHSPAAGSPLVAPWNLPELPQVAAGQTPVYLAAGYATVAAMLLVWSVTLAAKRPERD